jgi:transcriptional regulator with XRE-family HTH domain
MAVFVVLLSRVCHSHGVACVGQKNQNADSVVQEENMLIQKLRLQKGWSQQQLADLSGLSVRTIQRIEQGQVASPESLKSLAAVFEIPFSDLKESTMSATEIVPAPQPAVENAGEVLALRHVRKLKGFYIHLGQYVVVMLVLTALNLFTRPERLWVVWPALGWGVGLLFHAMRVFENLSPFGAKWEKAQVEKRLGRKL